MCEFIFEGKLKSFINSFINLDFPINHPFRLINSLVLFWIKTRSVFLIILHNFLIPEFSICLTLSLVIDGEKLFQILARVNLSQANHTLFSRTDFSLSDKLPNISKKLDSIFLLSKIVAHIRFLKLIFIITSNNSYLSRKVKL
jgi:hypothetical protein